MLQHIRIRIFKCCLSLFSCSGAQIIHDCIGTVEVLLRAALDFLHLDIYDRNLCNHHRDRADNHHEYQNGKQGSPAIIFMKRILFHRYSPFAESTVIY